MTRRVGAAGLTIVIAFLATTCVNWSASYHSGWREGSSAALGAVGLLATLWSAGATAVALRDTRGMRWRFRVLVGANAAIAFLFLWRVLGTR